jgi:hypothetical protein
MGDHRDEDDTNGDLPVWARITFKWGVGSAIALYLVYQVTQAFGSTLVTIRDEQRTHISETNFYLRQVCLNTAKDDVQRSGCYPTVGVK